MEHTIRGHLLDFLQPMTKEEAGAMFLQVLSVEQYCHRRSIVHRDLKPENILTVNTTIKVADLASIHNTT